MNFYTQLNEKNVVVGVSDLSGGVVRDDMISIPSYDLSLIGKVWDGKEFVENPNPSPEPISSK